jgi:hypothetical protein
MMWGNLLEPLTSIGSVARCCHGSASCSGRLDLRAVAFLQSWKDATAENYAAPTMGIYISKYFEDLFALQWSNGFVARAVLSRAAATLSIGLFAPN